MPPVLRLCGLSLLIALAAPLSRGAGIPPPPMKSAQVFGQKINYYDTGTGPALVLLHGLGSSAHFDWGRVMGPLARHHRVIALDQLGFATSDKPQIDYSVQTWVDFLGEFLRGMHVEHFTLGGASLGGWIAVDYTLQAFTPPPGMGASFALPRPDRLILVDAGGLGHKPPEAQDAAIRLALSPSSLAGTRAVLSLVFFNQALVTDSAVRASYTSRVSSGAGYTVHMFMNNPVTEAETVGRRLGGIKIPTLVVWGAEDRLVPLAEGREYAAAIPGAELAIIPKCGHVPPAERPAEFVAVAGKFLGDAETPALKP